MGDFYFFHLIFASQFFEMNAQQEYQQELEKIQQSDFKHNWVSSSGFLLLTSWMPHRLYVWSLFYALHEAI